MRMYYKPFPIAFSEESRRERANVRVSIKCPDCGWRLFDAIPPVAGEIDIKCQRCKRVLQFDLTNGIWLHQPEL